MHVTVSWHGHDEVRCFSVLDREEPKLRAIIISVECSDVLPFLSFPLPFSHNPRLTLISCWKISHYRRVVFLKPHMLWLDIHKSNRMLWRGLIRRSIGLTTKSSVFLYSISRLSKFGQLQQLAPLCHLLNYCDRSLHQNFQGLTRSEVRS